MASDVQDITIEYEEEGIIVTKELDKVILSRGAWTTIIFKFQDWDRQKETYGPEKFTIRRYRKLHGNYQQQSKFNISSIDQANKIIEALQGWIKA
ncbi:MAG: hypothetical protein OEV42_02950 [Deltaproteobacteria bacterium]|nr:hypothetical protein [Deltaproteobacteria bacterium]